MKTRADYRRYLNALYPNASEVSGKGANGRYRPTKRAYGDYLYAQDREMFEVNYQEWINRR